MTTPNPRRVYVVALVSGLLFVVGVAMAQWLATGTGIGTAKARVAEPLVTVAPSSSASAALYPGGTGDLHLTVSNPNPYPVTVSSVTGNGAISSDQAGCDASSHHVVFTDQTGLALSVAADGAAEHVLAGAVAMGVEAADACQGATFTIPVSLSGYSGAEGPGEPTDTGGVEGQPAPYDGPAGTEGIGLCQAGVYDADGNVTGAVHPSPEVPDALDNDCDGETDEDEFSKEYFDQDRDDWGDADNWEYMAYVVDGNSITWIHNEADYAAVPGDCDDTDPDVNPDAVEIANGIDDDCNGVVDDL